jgi:hypothetical protein
VDRDNPQYNAAARCSRKLLVPTTRVAKSASGRIRDSQKQELLGHFPE